MLMSWECSDQSYETSDEQRRVRSVSADRILEGEISRQDSISPDQMRMRSVSADRVLEGDRQDSLSSLHTLDSGSSSRTWTGCRAGYRTGYRAGYLHRRGWRTSWLGSQSLSAADESQNGR